MSPPSSTFLATHTAGQPDAEFVRIVAELIALAEERDRLMRRRSELVDELVALARNDPGSAGRAHLNPSVLRAGRQVERGELWRRDWLTAALGDPPRSGNGNAPGNGRLAGDPGS